MFALSAAFLPRPRARSEDAGSRRFSTAANVRAGWLAVAVVVSYHTAIALKDSAGFDCQRTRRDAAIDHRSRAQLDSLVADNVPVDRAGDYCHSDFDVGVHLRARGDNERSFLRKDLAGNVAVDAQQIFETDTS